MPPGSLRATVDSVGFTQDGSNVFARSTLDSESRRDESLSAFWEIPRWEQGHIPEWFLKMAEAIGRRRIDENGFPQDVSLEESRNEREFALSQNGAGMGVTLARKILAPAPTREPFIPTASAAGAPALTAPAPAPDSTPEMPAPPDESF